MDDIRQIVGRNVRLARAAKGLSQEDLADLTGLDRTYVSGVERGVRNPTVKVVQKLAQGLGLNPYQLLKDANAS